MSADLTIRPISEAQASTGPALASHPFRTEKKADAAQKFEAMVLQTFIQDMMPKESEGMFDSGIAGEFWRSLLSEKIAEQTAERGGFGIADFVRAGETVPTRPGGLVSLDVLSRISTLGEVVPASLDATKLSGD